MKIKTAVEAKMAKYPLYEKAKKLLVAEYHQNFEAVRGSLFHETYMNEKIRHSFQVSGAGNGILAHEPYFAAKSNQFIDVARTAVLLHDIYRFREVRLLFETGQKIRHDILGAEFLEKTADFNDLLIWLPIKYHGQMIERFYEDATYLSQDEKTQDELKHIAFAVRDADKIANWYLLAHAWEPIKSVWLKHPDDFSAAQTKINDVLWAYFARAEVAPNNLRDTNAEVLISVLCWLFDMNYTYSICFCKYHDLFGGLCDILRKMGVDEAKIAQVYHVMKNYVADKFNIII